MASDLRILHTADSHIGADLPKRRGGTRQRRGCDFVDSYRRVLGQATQLDVDLVIHAGDVFDTPQPGESALAAATQPLWELAIAGIPVILVPGNHERSVLPQALLLSHPNTHVLREPGTVQLTRRGLRIAVTGFPCIRRDAAQRFAIQLRETGWTQAAADIHILAVHQVFAGARCGPGKFQFRAGEDVVPCEAVPAGFHYVAAGHIHRHQSLAPSAIGGPPIVYAGAPDRITFAELGEPKGCVLVEFPVVLASWLAQSGFGLEARLVNLAAQGGGYFMCGRLAGGSGEIECVDGTGTVGGDNEPEVLAPGHMVPPVFLRYQLNLGMFVTRVTLSVVATSHPNSLMSNRLRHFVTVVTVVHELSPACQEKNQSACRTPLGLTFSPDVGWHRFRCHKRHN